MPDLVAIANDLKTVPDQWLVHEAQNPSGRAPSYLVLSELQRRQLLRSSGTAKQPPTSSVSQDTVQKTIQDIAPPPPAGPPSPPGMTPVSKGMPSGAMGAPVPGAQPPQNLKTMADGGSVDDEEDTSDDTTGGGYLGQMQTRPLSVPDLIARSSQKYGLNPAIAHAVAKIETKNYSPRAVSPKGAIGPMQLMPGTAKSLGVDPYNVAQNVDGGVRYLKQMYDQFGGDPRLTLAAYNAGPGAVQKHRGVPPFRETRNYVDRGMRLISGWEPPARSSAARATDEDSSATDTAAGATPAANFHGPMPTTGLMTPLGSTAGSTSAPASTGLAAAVAPPKPPEPEELTSARQRLQELTTGHTPYDPASALTADSIERNKQAVEAIMGKRPDYGQLEGAIAQLQNEAQKSMHPNISNMLMHLGFGLLASHGSFGQALGEAGLGMTDAMEKQRQQDRENYIEALKAGVNLQDKKNAYDEKVAALNFGQIKEQQQAGIAGEKSYQAQVENARKEVDRAQAAFTKTIANSPAGQMQARLDEINQVRTTAGQPPVTDLNTLPVEERNYVKYGTKPSGAGATDKVSQRLGEFNRGRELKGLPPVTDISQLPKADQDWITLGTKPPVTKPSIFDPTPAKGGTAAPGAVAPAAAPAPAAVTTPTPTTMGGVNVAPQGGFNEKVLEGLPPLAQTQVRGIATYSIEPPKGKLAADPDWQKSLLLAKQYDPSFDENRYKLRYDTLKDFTTGKTADNLLAAGQLTHHMEQLRQQWKDLNNWGGPIGGLANAPVNLLKDWAHRPDIAAFEMTRKAVSDELMKYFRGGGQASEKEAADWIKRLSPDAPPETQEAVLKSGYDLVGGRMKELRSKFESAMNRPADFSARFSPETTAILHRNGVEVGAAPKAPAETAPGGGKVTTKAHVKEAADQFFGGDYNAAAKAFADKGWRIQ